MNKFQEYAILDAQIKHLTSQKDELKEKILADMVEQNEKKVESDFGKFSITKLKTWTYPERVTALKDKYDIEKAKSESNGEATYEEKDSLRFTSVKF